MHISSVTWMRRYLSSVLTVEERRPATAALELGGALVKRCPAAGASVGALLAVLVVFASPRRLRAFLP